MTGKAWTDGASRGGKGLPPLARKSPRSSTVVGTRCVHRAKLSKEWLQSKSHVTAPPLLPPPSSPLGNICDRTLCTKPCFSHSFPAVACSNSSIEYCTRRIVSPAIQLYWAPGSDWSCKVQYCLQHQMPVCCIVCGAFSFFIFDFWRITLRLI